ncbi:hypothetical protein WR25_13152 [Diploscapter pachys]|uniref:Polyprenal reductase n=1 Tax=Diploscapter pachys TaxID=2018661 RepID=A0A2A2LPZ5_9BILA|nr:hypothetical protein WR25_13152 [Diploscapter pachys]
MLESLLAYGWIPALLTGAGLSVLLTCIANQFTSCQIIRNVFLYGKLNEQESSTTRLPRWFYVPKKWFSHFYIVSIVCIAFWLLFMQGISDRFFKTETRAVLKLRSLTWEHRAPSVSWSTAQFALWLLFIHSFRRAYETLYVSVFSSSQMNLLHYLAGLGHYFLLPLSIISETKGVVTSDYVHFSFGDISGEQWGAAIIFLMLNLAQNQIAHQMGDLRKSLSGTVRHYGYGVCYGGLFDLVSSPHFLLEMLIYVSMTGFLWQCFAFKFVLLFVVLNQMCAGFVTHQWYLSTFPGKYPKERKAIIPWIF